MKYLHHRSMANLSGWDTSSSQDTLVGIQLNKFTRALEVFKNNLKFIYEPKYKRTLWQVSLTKGGKQVRCNNKKTILEKPVFHIRFFQKVQETSVQWNLDLTKGQTTGKMCLPYQRGFVTSRFFFISYHDWGKENRLLYRGLCHTEVHYIEVPL